jgi:hypothetical protein
MSRKPTAQQPGLWDAQPDGPGAYPAPARPVRADPLPAAGPIDGDHIVDVGKMVAPVMPCEDERILRLERYADRLARDRNALEVACAVAIASIERGDAQGAVEVLKLARDTVEGRAQKNPRGTPPGET